MSFIKKGLKKAWKFVKNNWKMIVLAAAVVFTAGVATVGFGAFAAAGFGSSAAAGAATAASAATVAAGGAATAGTFGSFMGAVGSTMWAGVAGTAGTMGIGPGATLPAGSTIAGGAGTHVGLGAAFQGATGMGSGYGLGKAGADAAAAGLKATTANAYGTAYEASMSSVSNLGPTTQAAQQEAARQAGMNAAKNAASKFTGTGANMTKAGEAALKAGEISGKNAGMQVAKAWGPTIAGTLGPALVGMSDKGGGSLPWGAERGKGSYSGPGRNALEAPSGGTEPTAGVQAGPDPAQEGIGTELMMAQQDKSAQPMGPLMGVKQGRRGVDGRLLDEDEEARRDWDMNSGLMGMQGGYAYG